MKTPRKLVVLLLTTVFLGAPAFGQETASSPAASSSSSAAAGQPDEKEMMEMSKVGPNHKLLADLDGKWTYTVKFWMNGDPSSKPQESKGTATRESIMGGRYFIAKASSQMQMPDANGKMKNFEFNGMGTDAYDNATKQFVSTWIDNMGTGIMYLTGTYDESSKAFTYSGDYTPVPGTTLKIKTILKVPDNNHMNFEWYENRGGQEMKTMEINYTRKK
jgi:Protein of unknown function (DUF1579)